MFDISTIGYITLNISFVFYLALLSPQLVHNWKYRSTQKLSLGMHYVMCGSYTLDLLYGFGRHMQWQYKTVTIIGLICLAIQHIQIYRYGDFDMRQRRQYFVCTLILLCLFLSMIYGLLAVQIPPNVLIWAGGISQIGWFIYVIPQMVKNYRIQSTDGVSIYFTLLIIFLGVCDSVSAWSLGWDWPSRYGAPLGIILKLILLYQFFKYGRGFFHKSKHLEQLENIKAQADSVKSQLLNR